MRVVSGVGGGRDTMKLGGQRKRAPGESNFKDRRKSFVLVSFLSL